MYFRAFNVLSGGQKTALRAFRGTKLYACPTDATMLLVMETTDDSLSPISTQGVHSGTGKWSGITTVGTKVYTSPNHAPNMLEMDTTNNVPSGISTESIHSGDAKWKGITTSRRALALILTF